MRRDEWNAFVKEHMDISDRQTLGIMCSVNEADQTQAVASIAAKLYDCIIKKIPDIDFGGIPLSKGDITKIPNYMEISECLTTLRDLLIENKQSTSSVDTIFSSIEYLKRYKDTFMKGFTLECEMVVVTYNTIALSIVASTSLLLSSAIEFIKDPAAEQFDLCISKATKNNTKDGLLFKNLEKFNKACKKGTVEKAMIDLCKAQREVRESAVAQLQENFITTAIAAATLLALATCIIPILHQLTSFLACLRQNISDYFAVEADIIRLNAEKVNYDRSKSEESKKKIVAKQLKIADHFKSISNKLAIKSKKAESDAAKDIKNEEDKKYKADEVYDTLPDSSGGLF